MTTTYTCDITGREYAHDDMLYVSDLPGQTFSKEGAAEANIRICPDCDMPYEASDWVETEGRCVHCHDYKEAVV